MLWLIDGEVACGELFGYVDDGAYSYSASDPAVVSKVLTIPILGGN